MSASRRQFVGLSCSTYQHQTTDGINQPSLCCSKNITARKQMSELSHALISIAGGNEFSVRAVLSCLRGSAVSAARKSAHCLRCVGTCPVGLSQTWKRHGIRCKHSVGRNAHIFLQRIPSLHFHMKSSSVFLIILLISLKENGTISRRPALPWVRSDAASARIFS